MCWVEEEIRIVMKEGLSGGWAGGVERRRKRIDHKSF